MFSSSATVTNSEDGVVPFASTILKRYGEPSNMIFFKPASRNYDSFMNILSHSAHPIYSLPGLQHQTIARKSDGTQASEAWKQALAPGAATPPHYHECEEVICILEGMGEIAIEERREPFAADCTLILAPRVVHQITNTGGESMKLVAWLSESPARVFLPSGEQLALPWDGQGA
jgi:mannose-6-phosphate isomerase-like protein (cupin superfamily)